MMVLALFGLAFLLAFTAESMVEYFVGALMDKIAPLSSYRWAMIYVSAAVGVVMAIYWGIDLIAAVAALLELPTIQPTTGGMFLSGLAIGRGANYLHGMIQTYARPYQIGQPKTYSDEIK